MVMRETASALGTTTYRSNCRRATVLTREIYQHGIESEGVPACSSCNGRGAHGLHDFPRLAGQHAQYVLKQLGSFQNNMRMDSAHLRRSEDDRGT